MCDNYFDDIGLTLSGILGPEKAKRLAIYDREIPLIITEDIYYDEQEYYEQERGYYGDLKRH